LFSPRWRKLRKVGGGRYLRGKEERGYPFAEEINRGEETILSKKGEKKKEQNEIFIFPRMTGNGLSILGGAPWLSINAFHE